MRLNATIPRPSSGLPRFASSISDAVRAARQSAAAAPFVWVTSDREPAVRGLPLLRIEADPSGESFISWRFDAGRLTVQSDPLGLIPAFVYRRGSELAVSTSIPKLLAEGASVTVDRTALAVFLRLGLFVGADTPFQEIRALPPGARLTWHEDRSELTGEPYVVGETVCSRDDAIDRAIELTSRAVGRRLPAGPFAMPLSGGRDSRHILLELHTAGHVPDVAVTVLRYPPAAAEDPRIASLLAHELGLRHLVLDRVDPPAAVEARKNIETSYCADEHAWFYPMLDYLRGRVPLVYEGIGGSLWTVGWLPQRTARDHWQRGRTREVARQVLDRYSIVSDDFLNDLLTDPANWDRETAVERLTPELDRYSDSPDPGKAFHFWNRLRRELALVPFDQMRRFAQVHTPLVDRDLTEFLFSLPPEIVSPSLSRADKSFHSDAIRRAFPHVAHVPFEADDAAHRDASEHDRQLTVAVATYLLARRRPCRLMRAAWLLPRLAYILGSRRYSRSTRWLATTALYLAQVGDAAS